MTTICLATTTHSLPADPRHICLYEPSTPPSLWAWQQILQTTSWEISLATHSSRLYVCICVSVHEHEKTIFLMHIAQVATECMCVSMHVCVHTCVYAVHTCECVCIHVYVCSTYVCACVYLRPSFSRDCSFTSSRGSTCCLLY